MAGVKPHEFSDDLLLPQDQDELSKFMDEPLEAIAEAINRRDGGRAVVVVVYT